MKRSLISTMALVALFSSACSQDPDTRTAPVAQASPGEFAQATNLQYRQAKSGGTNPRNAFDLDLYYREGASGQKVVVFVHGGGWMRGDKSNIQKNPALLDFYLRKGYVVAAINFRLPERQNLKAVTYRDQAEDIAASIKWLSKNVQRYGGDPDQFILFGYSSGAHLAALVATDERYLAGQGLNIDVIKGAILMDVHTYDIPKAITSMRSSPVARMVPMIESLFGRTEAAQREASPASYTSYPGTVPFLIISAGVKNGNAQAVTKENSEAFKSKLKSDGHRAVHRHFGSKSHRSLAMEFGRNGDAVSRAVSDFLDGLKTSSLDTPAYIQQLATAL